MQQVGTTSNTFIDLAAHQPIDLRPRGVDATVLFSQGLHRRPQRVPQLIVANLEPFTHLRRIELDAVVQQRRQQCHHQRRRRIIGIGDEVPRGEQPHGGVEIGAPLIGDDSLHQPHRKRIRVIGHIPLDGLEFVRSERLVGGEELPGAE